MAAEISAGERGLWRRCMRAKRQRIVLVFVGAVVFVVMAGLAIELFGYKSVYVIAPLSASLFGTLSAMTVLAVSEQRRGRCSRE